MCASQVDTDPILAEIVKRLVKEFNPKRLFLFGSRARGDAHESSDYDILLVISSTVTPCYRLAQKAHRYVLNGIPAPVDVMIITENQFEAKKKIIGTIPEAALYEGQELHVA